MALHPRDIQQATARQEVARQGVDCQGVASQEISPREAGCQEATNQEAVCQEAVPWEAVRQEAAPQEAAPQEDMRTLALKLSYRGEAFSGFARQPQQLTVQGELEHALELLFRQPVLTTCAGRTDTGVHARAQVVSFQLPQSQVQDLQAERFLRSMNALTHEDISVYELMQVANGFSARFDAKAREYRYFLSIDPVSPVFARDFAWHVGPLDVDTMRKASRCLIGEHDFKSFCKAVSAEGKPTSRNLLEISFSYEQHAGENLLVVRVVGSSFLHSMVRTLVGTLVAVGREKRPASWVQEVLEARDRKSAGECAPACGLVFWDVRY